MTIFHFKLALLAFTNVAQTTLVGPATAPARNELERLVLGPLDDREKVADWLELHARDAAALRKAMAEIDFEPVPSLDPACRNYVYARVVGEKSLTRWASVVWCKGRPFVLLSAGYPNVPAPARGSDAPTTPLPPGYRP
ncbi:hypothetical protein AB2M62_05250 [Sphingomonas sp. MMS12-HWE2-04]|uniref:hypothetical protein n=1 Tax=Sphingomonas sp. MMS12-HWE2-04 TaxID=3234199 RepID=UPI00385104D7